MIRVMGVGIDGRESLGASDLKALLKSDILVGSKRHLDSFPDFEGERLALGKLSLTLEKIDAAVEEKKSVALLATGDPCLFGIGPMIVGRYGKRLVRISPNVSVVQEAFSRLGESWNDLRILSVHGRGMGDALEKILESPKTAVFTDAVNTPDRIAKELLKRRADGFSAHLFERLGTPDEKITRGSLKAVADKKFDPLNLMVLIKDGVPLPALRSARLAHGLPDDAFSSDNMITKEEVRAVTMAKLQVEENSVVWDIGAGCGSVSIEAGMAATGGVVYAIEKNDVRAGFIAENIKKFGLSNVRLVKGLAPAGLKGLPRPDRVFVGGGGRDMKKILSSVSKKILPGARVVVNAVTVETLTTATDFFSGGGWEVETVSVSVSRTKKAGESSVFSALNPVFTIRAMRKNN
jgi:precorrin-6Y C5,15-methyltransferase (decarboxylating)